MLSTDWQARLPLTAGPVLQEERGRACVFSLCYVHVSPDLFLLRFSICLPVLPVIPCGLILLVPTMHDGDRRLILCLNKLYPAYCMSITCLFSNSIYHLFPFLAFKQCWIINVVLFRCFYNNIVPFVSVISRDHSYFILNITCYARLIGQVIELPPLLNKQLVRFKSI